MKLSDCNLTLAQHKEGEWYFFEVFHDYSNTVTGIKIDGEQIFVQYIGGDFEEPFEFWFDYSQAAFNEIWQYEFREDYIHPLNPEVDTLSSISELSTSVYSMINDLNYAIMHMGEVNHE